MDLRFGLTNSAQISTAGALSCGFDLGADSIKILKQLRNSLRKAVGFVNSTIHFTVFLHRFLFGPLRPCGERKRDAQKGRASLGFTVLECGLFTMDSEILLDSEHRGGGGYNTRRGKMVWGESVGGAPPQKILADITNLQQQCPKPSGQPSKLRSVSLATDNITDQLQKENATLVKLLANRNAIIESNGAELLKLQSNFQKLQKQNLQLAKANSQMLGELNSSRQRLRELQHELGCKNGMLKASEREYMEKQDRAKVTCEIAPNEVGSSQSEQSGETFQVDSKENCRGHGKRRRASKSQSSVSAAAEQVNSIEKFDNQRYCLRRQSRGFNAEKPGPTEDVFEVHDNESSVTHHKENLVTETRPASSRLTVPEATTEHIQSLGATNIDEVHAKEKVDSKRRSLRRQSTRFEAENSEPTEDLFAIDDASFPVLVMCDDQVVKSCTTTLSATFGQDNKGTDSAINCEAQEIRRSSIGRPLRQAAVKVQSYKEIPLNLKMRRPE
ncbi:hypothetical protein L6164_006902 [Bauhinia variegata]|uniref:Uncharacterized protein n=1 Tax=Bauhinia variegata TaxID=167791 RepID=A0ACB9PVA2_BAUVA|nr:hypothetical protein L6164_006902 [Bauhinia variegata]